MKRLSVIIPGFGRQRAQAETQAGRIRVLTAAAGLDAEVIVADGTSVGVARNDGLRRATGAWVAWVDADDEVTDDWAEEIRKATSAADDGDGSRADDIVFDMFVVRRGRETLHAYGRASSVDPKVLVADVLRSLRIGNHLFRHVSRRTLWAGVRFADVRFLEDALALPVVLGGARAVSYVAKPVYRHLVRADGLCASNDGFDFFDLLRRRADAQGGAAVVGAALCAYGCLYDRADRKGAARRWIRRRLPALLTDREVDVRWKLKFLLAAAGIIVRRPK